VFTPTVRVGVCGWRDGAGVTFLMKDENACQALELIIQHGHKQGQPGLQNRSCVREV
jgi:hypothetical protein